MECSTPGRCTVAAFTRAGYGNVSGHEHREHRPGLGVDVRGLPVPRVYRADRVPGRPAGVVEPPRLIRPPPLPRPCAARVPALPCPCPAAPRPCAPPPPAGPLIPPAPFSQIREKPTG